MTTQFPAPACFSKLSRVALAALLSVGLANCSDKGKSEAQNATQKGQVIAKVGDTDVTIHELQNEYKHLRITPDQLKPEVTRQVLAEVVKRKALAQRAQTSKLDREPATLLDLIRAREQVLATALVQRDLQTKFAAIGKAELDRYINANPTRFARRIRFDIDRLSIPTSAETPDFVEAVKNASVLDIVEKEVVVRSIQYTRGASLLYSTEMPPELLQRMTARKDSDIFVIRSGQASLYFKIKSEASDPLSGPDAERAAQAMLRSDIAREELQRKTSAGDVPITYFGEYTKLMAETPATPAPAAQPAPQPPKTP